MTINQTRPATLRTPFSETGRDFVHCDVVGCEQGSVMTKTAEMLWCECELPKHRVVAHICPYHSNQATDEGRDLTLQSPGGARVVLSAASVPVLDAASLAEAKARRLDGIFTSPSEAKARKAKIKQMLEQALEEAELAAAETNTDALDI